MRILVESTLENFKAWSGAVNTKKAILEAGLENEFENLIDETYPDGIDETTLNDLLWFENEWIYEMLGMEVEE